MDSFRVSMSTVTAGWSPLPDMPISSPMPPGEVIVIDPLPEAVTLVVPN